MARRARSRAQRRSAIVADLPWSQSFKTVFRLAGDAWTPPEVVRVRYGVRSWTLAADFRDERGVSMRLKTRLGLGRDGRPATVLEESLLIVATLRGARK